MEVDVLLDMGSKLVPIEIKSAQTFNAEYLKNLHRWNNFSKQRGGLLLYDGQQEFLQKDKIKVQNWREISKMKI